MENFQSLDEANVEAAPEVSRSNTKKEANKAQLNEMKRGLLKTIETDPTYTKRHKMFSDSLVVVNSLGFGDSGNLVRAEGTGERKVVPTSKIVGYIIENVGTEPIPYKTEEFAPDETGKYVGTKVDRVLGPGEKVAISRKYFTILCAIPEISFQLKNGILVKSSADFDPTDLEAMLNAQYFTFSDKSIKVNSDDIKINISSKKKNKATGEEKWVVKKEYEKIFGYLNNEVEKTAKTRGGSKEKFKTQDAVSNYIYNLLNEKGI